MMEIREKRVISNLLIDYFKYRVGNLPIKIANLEDVELQFSGCVLDIVSSENRIIFALAEGRSKATIYCDMTSFEPELETLHVIFAHKISLELAWEIFTDWRRKASVELISLKYLERLK